MAEKPKFAAPTSNLFKVWYMQHMRHERIDRRIREAFDPVSLFANGEQGAWYDPSDLTTLYQDSAGTTPVTADGDPVGLMLDKSGNGNHASQEASGLKPIYRTDGVLHWLEADGFDDSLPYPVAAQGAASDNNFMAAASVTSSGFYLLGNRSDRGAMLLPGATGARATVYTSALNVAGATSGIYTSGTSLVISSQSDITGGSIDINLTTGYESSTSFSPANKIVPVSSALFSRGRGETVNSFGGKFYGALIVNRLATPSERSNIESYLAQKSGVTL